MTTPPAGRPMLPQTYVAAGSPGACPGGCEWPVVPTRRGDGAYVVLIVQDGHPGAEHDVEACLALVPSDYFDGAAGSGWPWP